MLIPMPRARIPAFLEVGTEKGWISPGAAKVLKTATAPVLALGALAWVTLALFRSGPVQPQLYAEFVDASRSSYLDVQLDSSQRSYGAFSASLPGEGRVWPAARVEARPTSAVVVNLHYDGIGHQDPKQHPDSGSDEESGTAPPPPQVVQLRLVGQVDPAHHTASVDVWVNGRHHHVGSAGEPSGAEAVATEFLTAVSTGDWDTVYDLEDPYMRNGTKQSDFITAMAGLGPATRISGAEVIGSMTHSTTGAGVSYARTPVRLTYTTGTETTTLHANLALVVDEGAWKVLSLE